MKYEEYFKKNFISEWSSQYLNYEILYEYLQQILLTINQSQSNNNSNRQQYFLHADQEFFQFCEQQLNKINTFFAEKLAESLLRLNVLKNEIESLKESEEEQHHSVTYSNPLYLMTSLNSNDEQSSRGRQNSLIRKRRQMKSKRSLKLALSEFYLMLIFLKNYQTLNYQGFIEILTKHDQLFETTRAYQWRITYIDCALFYQSLRVDQFINEVENLYTNSIENGNRTRAMERLRLPPLEEKQSQIVTFRLGILIGMISLLIPFLILILIFFSITYPLKILDWRTILHLYRSSFCLIIDFLFFAINVYGWSLNGVNHVLIFEIDRRNHLTYQNYLEIGTFLLVCWLISLHLFVISFYLDFYPFIQPLILMIILILFIINPIRIFYRNSRIWFMKKLFRVFISPLSHVNFIDFWLADQLCSLELIFFDLQFFICFYINENNFSSSNSSHTILCNGWLQVFLQSLFICLPSWFRFCQCLRRYYDTKQTFPHLVNAGKYASSFFVIITNALRRVKHFDYHQDKLENLFFYLWILTALISSTYKLIWDVKMDWGFLHKNAGENKYLREQIIYQRKIYYYISIVLNIVFRYIWIINIFLQFNSLFAEYSDIIGFSFALIEIFRRFIWNYFRLENEHLNNCGQFRAVRDISIRPTPIINDNFTVEQQANNPSDSQFNSNDDRITTTDNIPMTIINDSHRISRASFVRRKTNAEEFIEEINDVLTTDTNSNATHDNRANAIR